MSGEDIQNVILMGAAVGTAIGAVMVTVISGVYRFIKSQTLNGDGRSLRDAVDDMAKELKQHRRDMDDRHSHRQR